MQDFSVFSLDVIERAGFNFKVSSNNYDGGVLIIATHDFFGYSTIKYFPSAQQAREWTDSLVDSTKNVCRSILDEE